MGRWGSWSMFSRRLITERTGYHKIVVYIQELYSVFFLDFNLGWIAGWSGIILKTTDGGTNWIRQFSNPPSENLHSVMFIDANNGWIVGDKGKILKQQMVEMIGQTNKARLAMISSSLLH